METYLLVYSDERNVLASPGLAVTARITGPSRELHTVDPDCCGYGLAHAHTHTHTHQPDDSD